MMNVPKDEKVITSHFALRSPNDRSAEIVLVKEGKMVKFPLTFDQLRLLNAQSEQAIYRWEEAERKQPG
jgi:hypothetical protein